MEPPTELDYTDIVHTGPGTLAGRFMRMFWQPVARAQDLQPGRALPIKILGEQFTLYRGQGGVPHLVGFRCAHRHTQLSTGWVEDDTLRCFYHGWRYDGTGQCVEQPAEDEPFAQKIRIPSYPTQEYLGLIFVYIGEGPAPELPRFPGVERDGVLDVVAYTWPDNYFYSIDNDPVHIAFVHRDSDLTKRGLDGLPKISAEESDWGMTTYASRPGSPVRATQIGIPNSLYVSVVPGDPEVTSFALNLAWRVPVDDESHTIFRVNHTPVTGDAAKRFLERRGDNFYNRARVNELGEQVLAGKLRIEDIEDRTYIEYVQDYVSQVGQGGLENRESEHLGRSDVSVILFRKLWTRELKALAEGRPLKNWRLTPELEPTSGL